MAGMFASCSSLENLDLMNFNTSNVTTFGKIYNGMFFECAKLTILDLSNFDVSNVKNFNYMFKGCKALSEIKGIESWNTKSMVNIEAMFAVCTSLTNLDLSKWSTDNLTNVMDGNSGYGAFGDCSSLTTLNVTGWNVSKVTNMTQLFRGCASLKVLDLSTWDMSKVTTINRFFDYGQKLEMVKLPELTDSIVTTIFSVGFVPSTMDVYVKSESNKDAVLAKKPNYNVTVY